MEIQHFLHIILITETCDVSHAFLSLSVAKLQTLKQVFGAHLTVHFLHKDASLLT